ncbi:hypothetical protein NPIL_580801 [Nephila pilipes]|uniref:Uncharacterized protein n=1 Tax=Nephila pilipes TaxID=299642 RepID=A0A8X6QRV8_NEPPI|nr:hypothetical protein NPIL_580801 [Nephila pilipes]
MDEVSRRWKGKGSKLDDYLHVYLRNRKAKYVYPLKGLMDIKKSDSVLGQMQNHLLCLMQLEITTPKALCSASVKCLFKPQKRTTLR